MAVPAATLGVFAGVLATYGPDHRLLTMLNEPPPGIGLLWPLAAGWAASVLLPVAGAAWPAWRAAGRPPVALLRGGELAGVAAAAGAGRFSGAVRASLRSECGSSAPAGCGSRRR